MLAKFIVILALILIVGSLGAALIHLLRNPGSKQTVNALTWRIGLSIALVLCLLIAAKLGLIKPHGLGQTNATQENPATTHQ